MKASNNTCYQTSYRYFQTLKKVKSLKISIWKYFLEIGYSGKLLEFQWIWVLCHFLLTYFYVAMKVMDLSVKEIGQKISQETCQYFSVYGWPLTPLMMGDPERSKEIYSR